jgi:hypothetical protein
MKCWIAVASADHVRFGRSAGFMQVSHGKPSPLARLQPGDCIAYYSPTARFRGSDKLQTFTAIGVVKDGEPYRADMGNGFHPHRRDVRWLDSQEAPIHPLLARLSFSRGVPNWGYRLRLGLIEIPEDDMRTIAAAMDAKLPVSVPAMRVLTHQARVSLHRLAPIEAAR